jgi:hypothetical protein
MAREAVTEFRGQLDEPTYNDLRLVVSELVADAVRAEADGTNDLNLMIEVGNGGIWASVGDGVAAFKLKSRRPELGESGWGIHLARLLGRRWGSTHDATRCSIWVEMERSDRALSDRLLRLPRPTAARAGGSRSG